MADLDRADPRTPLREPSTEASFGQIAREEIVRATTAFFAPYIGAKIVLDKLTARSRANVQDRWSD